MPSNNAKRTSALLATAAITLSGLSLAPVAFAADTNAVTAAESASSASTISNATMSWGLKESFRTYFEKSFVGGVITPADGLATSGNGILNFSGGTGTYDPSTKIGEISFPGSVNYNGHHGQLDINFNNFKLEINGTTGTLKISGTSKDMQGNVHTFSDSDFATIDLSNATISDTEISLNGGAATLTEAGASAFAGFYQAGTELDPITFSAPLTAPEPTETATPTETASAAPTANETTPAATAPELPAYEASQGNLSEGTLSWGIKESLRTYILTNPYAKGTQTLDGVTYSDVYGFSTGTGNYDESTKTGEISFPGTIKYSAHGGVLDIALTNVTVKINGDKGEIIADGYTRNGRTGEYESFTDRVIQTVDLSGLKVEDGKLIVENAATTFTDAGGATFGRYSSADATDPVSFTATIKTAAETPAPVVTETASPTPTATETAAPSPTATETASPAPTATETATPAPSETTSAAPIATETSAPAPAPSSSPTTESATRFNVESGTMNWGFKDSFRNYISGPIANGSAEVSDGITAVSNGFDWSNVTDGAFDTETGEGFVKFGGSVHFTGHHGQLDLTFSNIQFQTYKENGELKGYIVADVESKLLSGGTFKKEALTIAVVNTDGLKFVDGKVTLESAAVALTESGAIAFATSYDEATGAYTSMYKPGDVLSPLTLNLTLGKKIESDKQWNRNGVVGDPTTAPENGTKETDTTGEDPTTNTTEGTADKTVNNSVSLGDQQSNGASSDPASSAPATCVPVQVTETVPGTSTEQSTGKATVANATMNWGLRSSFRNYISGGIANGGWNLDGVTYSNSTFNFANGTGSLTDGSGTVSFTGSINFYGHKGVLNTTFSDLALEINGKTGVLYAHVVSNDMNGNATDYGRVAFANVDLSAISITANKLTINSAAATLTEDGSKAFAGFYNAGEALDPITLSADLTSETKTVTSEATTVTKTVYQGDNCDALNAASGSSNGSNLAYTGVSSTLPVLITAGGVLLLAGAATIVMARRRQA